MTTQRSRLTVVIPTRDRPELLRKSLASVAADLGPDDELVVVDSASVDGDAVGRVAAEVGATLSRCEQPGAARARNRGWNDATTELVAFIDDDVRVAPGWADAMRVALDDPTVGFVTGRTSAPDDHTEARPVAVKDDEGPARFGVESSGHLGQSANMGARREALEAVGGFDEELGPGSPRGAIAEDTDLFDRLLIAGWAGHYAPEVRAEHDQWRTKTQLLRLDWRYGRGNGFRLAKLLRIHRPRARIVARDVFWGWGFGDLIRGARAGEKTTLVAAPIRIVATCVGFAQGLVSRLDGGHYRPRR